MEHLDGHPHAFLDSENKVIAMLVFDSHDSEFLQQIKDHYEASDVKCCCDHGFAWVGGDFYNGKFYDVQPDLKWVRDETQGIWVDPLVGVWVDPLVE
jgi:hypothetical protein